MEFYVLGNCLHFGTISGVHLAKDRLALQSFQLEAGENGNGTNACGVNQVVAMKLVKQ